MPAYQRHRTGTFRAAERVHSFYVLLLITDTGPCAMIASSMAGNSVPTILVVDDMDAVRHLARRILEAGGYRVYEAADGVEALACLARDGKVDLVVTDVRMPNMDGWELASHLAGQSPRVPVLFMSGYDEHLGSQSLLGPILPKPFTAEQLYERIRGLLGHQPDGNGAVERQG
jgi:CheY-like chemotaxis protein